MVPPRQNHPAAALGPLAHDVAACVRFCARIWWRLCDVCGAERCGVINGTAGATGVATGGNGTVTIYYVFVAGAWVTK
jgi:hypothetical protein